MIEQMENIGWELDLIATVDINFVKSRFDESCYIEYGTILTKPSYNVSTLSTR